MTFTYIETREGVKEKTVYLVLLNRRDDPCLVSEFVSCSHSIRVYCSICVLDKARN